MANESGAKPRIAFKLADAMERAAIDAGVLDAPIEEFFVAVGILVSWGPGNLPREA